MGRSVDIIDVLRLLCLTIRAAGEAMMTRAGFVHTSCSYLSDRERGCQ